MAAQRYGIEGAYERFAVPPGEFADFAASIGVDGLVGANVTVPHKEAAFAACDRLDRRARPSGAVNTLWREDGALCGDNTDVAGFLANLDDEAPGWRERGRQRRRAGRGRRGARDRPRRCCRAASSASPSSTAPATRAERARRALRPGGARGDLGRIAAAARRGRSARQRDDRSAWRASRRSTSTLAPLKAEAIVADVVYVPLTTPLLEAAWRRGCVAVDGLGMLLHQAAPGFDRWFGERPTVTAELRALIEADLRAAEKGRT